MGFSLKQNFGFALIGNLGYAASQYIILLVFVKLYSMEDVGTFVFAGAFTSPLMLALEMQLRNLYLTDNGKLSFQDYNSFRVVTSSVGVVGLIVAAFFLKPEYIVVITIVALIKTFESQLDLLYGIYQKKNYLNFVAYSRLIRGGVAIITVFVVSYVFKDLTYSLLAYLFSWIILYFFYERRGLVKRDFITSGELKFVGFDRAKYKSLIILCFPIFCSIFIDKYYLNYPRISVERLLGVEALAVFGSLMYFKALGGQFITSLAQAAMPKLAEYVRTGRKNKFLSLITKLVGIGIGIGSILVVINYFYGSEILRLLYTDEYAKYSDVLVIILLGTTLTFGYSFITSSYTALRKQWIRLPISIIMLALIIVLFWLKQVDSLLDVAYIILISESINFVVFYITFFIFFKNFFKNETY